MFPHYLAMGMSHDLYWYGQSRLTKCYRIAHNIQLEHRNQQLWLQGMYIMDAFAVVLGNAFGGKGRQKQSYLKEPIRITPLTPAQKAQKQRQEWLRIDKALHMMKAQQEAKKKAKQNNK